MESYFDKFLAENMTDPEFAKEFELQKRLLGTFDRVINDLEGLREASGKSKATVAREIGKNPASIRRLLTAPVNPELRTVIAVADALGADVRIVPRTPR